MVGSSVFLTDQWKPLNLEEKKRYDREFLLGFQFIFASMQKPEGLPHISDVVLDKVGGLGGIGQVVLDKFVLAGWLDGEEPEVLKEQSVALACF